MMLAIAKRGVAVLIVPVDISHSDAKDDVPYAIHTSHPVIRPTDADLDQIAAIINSGEKIAIYGGSGCRGAHDEIVRAAEILRAPIAHTSRAKDCLEYGRWAVALKYVVSRNKSIISGHPVDDLGKVDTGNGVTSLRDGLLLLTCDDFAVALNKVIAESAVGLFVQPGDQCFESCLDVAD
jgi:hypothetical protein